MFAVTAHNPFARQPVRASTNPFDKSTIFSIWPKPVYERKITLSPGEFVIPAGSVDNPATLVIGPSSWWREVGEHEPLLEISQPSAVIADSLCKDYMNGMLGCDMIDSMPGLFWLPGDVSVEALRKEHKKHLLEAERKQKNYFQALVKLADAMWARSNGNPLAIYGDSILAAKHLGLEKEWSSGFAEHAPTIVRCVACGSMRNPLFPICPTCKTVVDHELAKKMNIKFAE